jgi:glycerate dehydrogenase
MHGVFLDADSIDRGDIDFAPLTDTLDHWVLLKAAEARPAVKHVADAEVVVSNKVLLDRDTIAAAPKLKLICVAATGTNNVDLDAARDAGIPVTNVTRYASNSVAQHVFGLTLALTTRLFEYRESVRNGAWNRSPFFCLLDHPVRELAGKTLGIIGYGELGHATAKIGGAFGMRVLVAQRPGAAAAPDRVPLDTLLETADVISIHCPLTPETRGLIGAEQLARMKPDALLINTARGGIVDEDALANALRRRALGGAGIDVLEVEPPRADSPLLAADIPNLIVTPHIAWASVDSRQRLLNQVAENVLGFLRGDVRNRVN